MKVTGIICPKCGDFVFSRTRHDMRWCSCGEVAADGGFDYLRVAYKKEEPPKSEEREIEQTKKELFDDWNTGTDKFGRICHIDIHRIGNEIQIVGVLDEEEENEHSCPKCGCSMQESNISIGNIDGFRGETCLDCGFTQVDPNTPICKFCNRHCPPAKAHRHQEGYVGECCWDDRLKNSE